jgi:predicted transcriptional regulator
VFPELSVIQEMRKKLGMSQRQLARALNLSSAMINQVESGVTQPSYETAKRIVEYLHQAGGDKVKIGDICHKGVIRLSSSEKVSEAIKKMRENDISQIPIIDKNICTGIITEEKITSLIDNEGITKFTILNKVKEPAAPSFPYEYPAKPLRMLLLYSRCILVTQNDRIYGIVTHQDFHKLLE